MKKVAIIGQGYVGLPLAVRCAANFDAVFGLDIDENRIKDLRNCISPVADVTTQDLKAIQSSGVYFPSSEMRLLSEAEIVVICVPTPLDDNQRPNLKFLDAAIEEVARYATDGSLIVNESTSFPGTLRRIIKQRLDKERPNSSFRYAVAPERIDPGNTEWSFSETPRLLGALDEESLDSAYEFYSTICQRVTKVSSAEVAELAKLLENAFRQVNIALVTEFAKYCEVIGIDVHEVVEAASSKPYGYMPFYPGIGVGGHCIPIDPIYLAWDARQHSVPMTLIEKSSEINENRPNEISKKILRKVSQPNSKILIAGISYKPGIADLRESPALEIFRTLSSQLINVLWWDSAVGIEVDGKQSASLEDKYEYVFLMHEFNEETLKKFTDACSNVFDCSGKNSKQKGIKKI